MYRNVSTNKGYFYCFRHSWVENTAVIKGSAMDISSELDSATSTPGMQRASSNHLSDYLILIKTCLEYVINV